ncbi:MAG TPA: hypothetical protein VF062_22700 [Candidatus Limnocylindrales bacterium]
MRSAVGLLTAVVLLATGCGGGGGETPVAKEPAPAPGDHTLSFTKPGGVKQDFLLHAPKDFAASNRYPLIVVFHGSPGTPSQMQSLSGLDDLADREGFITVYPDLGREPETVGQLLDHLISKWSIDPKRIHLAGFSMGATAVYGLAHALASRVGSVAPVSGIGASETATTGPVSLITFQGGRDAIAGGFPANNAGWAKAAQCEPATVTEATVDGGRAMRHTANCKGGAEFVIYDVAQMGHGWPPEASGLIWEFFKKHPLA